MASSLSAKQIKSMKQEACLGGTLQVDMPEIAEDYLKYSAPQIVENRGVCKKYSVGAVIAENAVRLAIRGHEGALGIPPYKGLITNAEELRRLAREHQARNFKSLTHEQRYANGRIAYEKGLGVHGFTEKQRFEASQRGGIAARDGNFGFHAFNEQKRKEISRNALIAQGYVPWEPEAEARVLELAQDPAYQCGNKGPSYERIAKQINLEFHNGQRVRTRHSINHILFKKTKRENKLKED